MLEGMVNDICGSDLFASVHEILNKNLFADGGDAISAVMTLHETIKPLALMLMFLYFMIAVVDKLSGENFTWEQLWRQMAMLLAAKYLIDHGFEILNILSNVGVAVFGYIGDASIKEVTVDAQALIETFRKEWGLDDSFFSFLADIVMIVYLLLPWLLSWIMRICVSVICYSRMIEIYIRAIFAPVAVSDFFHSGLQGAGWRFLKNFLAVSLQGALIMAIAVIFGKLMATFTVNDANLFTFIGKYLAFYASAVMLMFKSLSLSKELVGTA